MATSQANMPLDDEYISEVEDEKKSRRRERSACAAFDRRASSYVG
jgi:hypothetical protein